MQKSNDEIYNSCDDEQEVMVCPDCMTGNDPRAHFCKQCAMPLSSHAAIDPIGQIHAQGWLYRKAIRSRPRPVILIGMWMVFLPVILYNLFNFLLLLCPQVLFTDQPYLHQKLDTVKILFIATGFLVTIIMSAILFRFTYSYVRYDKSQHGADIDGEEMDEHRWNYKSLYPFVRHLLMMMGSTLLLIILAFGSSSTGQYDPEYMLTFVSGFLGTWLVTVILGLVTIRMAWRGNVNILIVPFVLNLIFFLLIVIATIGG